MAFDYLAYKPEDLSNEAWQEIISSWQDGLSDREAAIRASRKEEFLITEGDLREYLEANPEVADLKDYLQSDVVSMAKKNIAKSVREAANEYSTKASLNFENAVIGLTMAEKQAEMDKFLDSFLSDSDEVETDGEGQV